MHKAIRYKTFYTLVLVATLLLSCRKRDDTTQQKIVGSWKSTNTVTQLYEDDNLRESYTHESDEYSGSVMEFYTNGSFKSSGKYATTDADSITIVRLEDQKGHYQVIDNKLITKIENIDKEAEMTVEFKGNDVLIITSDPLALPHLDKFNNNKYFVSTVTYVRNH
ncbi:hypothetical protein RYH73_18285 [Olivibacter sp. CPCC 100613]|uniref:hypothetical protein n=1 Tax=Olivibacter sp. CPCC 100613 TaxID=3079931 RepID=UPI002FF575E6